MCRKSRTRRRTIPEHWQSRQLNLVRGHRWLGDQKLKFARDENGLHVSLPEKFDGKTAFALKIQS